MKIAIIGYGKMGKVIEKLALAQGHEVILRISRNNLSELNQKSIVQVNVAIEFTSPETAVQNISFCLENNVPVVSGTTGWLDKMDEIRAQCSTYKGAFFYASNFSIGVNIFFAMNRLLSSLMKDKFQYDVLVDEIHHTQKQDYPSGTAITLSEDIIARSGRKHTWKGVLKGKDEEVKEDDILQITSQRIGVVPGTHHVKWVSAIDEIEISHVAHSREGFAAGALSAAEWIIGKQGCFGMDDMLGFVKEV